MPSVVRRLVVLPIRLYQKLISPLFPARCRYHPSCSHYTKEAVLRHGMSKGLVLGLARILRCNALFEGGPDAVPLLRRWGQIVRRIGRDYRRRWAP